MSSNFARYCHGILVIWLFAIFAPINLYLDHENSPDRVFEVCYPDRDFSQYYLAGAAARYQQWDHLYPTIKPEWVGKPGYRVWDSVCADVDPSLLAKIPGLPRYYVNNIAPPPQALICLPLAFFSFSIAFKIWMVALLVAIYGIVRCAVRIYRRCGGRSGLVEGFFFLSGAIIPLIPRISGGDNAMLFLVFCVGTAAVVWTRERPLSLATCLVFPGLGKGMTAIWCPLLLVPPVRWGAIAWIAAWTLVLNGAVLVLAGTAPYSTWIRDVLPNAQNMEAQGYWSHCMNLQGLALHWGWTHFPSALRPTLLALGAVAVYYGFWRQRFAVEAAAETKVCAAAVAGLVLFNLCNAVSWLPYITFLAPFAGWALVEFSSSSKQGRQRVMILSSLLLLVVPGIHCALIPLLTGTPGNAAIFMRDFVFGIELLFLYLAYRRLYSAPPLQQQD